MNENLVWLREEIRMAKAAVPSHDELTEQEEMFFKKKIGVVWPFIPDSQLLSFSRRMLKCYIAFMQGMEASFERE